MIKARLAWGWMYRTQVLYQKSYVDVEDLDTLPHKELQSYVGKVEKRILEEIKMILKYILDLD